MYTYVHMYMHVCTSICICICEYTYVYTNTYMCTCMLSVLFFSPFSGLSIYSMLIYTYIGLRIIVHICFVADNSAHAQDPFSEAASRWRQTCTQKWPSWLRKTKRRKEEAWCR